MMNSDRIDLISSYCDRWCERCSFTSRCSLFAVQIAIAMCGDVADGIELAVGQPHDEPGVRYGSTMFPPEADFDFEASEVTLAECLEFAAQRREHMFRERQDT